LKRTLGTPTPIEKPFSAACERNRDPILRVLRGCFADRRRILEIGSGTGQHAVHFAAALPHLVWQTSDRAENLPGIGQWLDEAKLANALAPLEFDVDRDAVPVTPAAGPSAQVVYDAIFSANTLHIMSWPEVEKLFAALPALSTDDAKLAIYGPFNYGGKYTSVSNADFDRSLKQHAAHMGIRDVTAVDALARGAGFDLMDDVAMPANNRCRVWQRAR
jgi:cyclopropane fatty-acyl-phospholipid synthase-like methyltransferase